MNLLPIAKESEKSINDILMDNPYNLPNSVLYGLTMSGETIEIDHISEHEDVYQLLSTDSSKIMEKYKYVGVVTTGWASPLNDDGEAEGAPSQHPERRRVRLMVIANRENVVSVLRFEDEPNEPIFDEGNATGSLANAILQFVNK